MGETQEIDGGEAKKRQKRGPKKRGPGPPGRGVLRFLAQAYRRPVHFLAKNAVFSKKW